MQNKKEKSMDDAMETGIFGAYPVWATVGARIKHIKNHLIVLSIMETMRGHQIAVGHCSMLFRPMQEATRFGV